MLSRVHWKFVDAPWFKVLPYVMQIFDRVSVQFVKEPFFYPFQ